jgi:rRNA maturation endonuclease Nob1
LRLYNPSDPFVEDELSVSLPTLLVEIQVLPGEAYIEAINVNINLPEYITPNITQAESSNRRSTKNDEELAKIGGTGVEESQQEDAENYKYSARQTTPSLSLLLPTLDETPRPGNSGSN